MPDFKEIAQLGGTVVVVVCFLWFMYEQQKLKKSNGDTKVVDDKRDAIDNNRGLGVLKELQTQLELMNSNHLHSIEICIKDGNANIVSAINDGNMKMIEKLGEICGKLK